MVFTTRVLYGTSGPDILTDINDNGSTYIHGLGSDDIIYGLGGYDVLDGGSGLDELRGGADNDDYILNDATLINSSYTWDTVIENANEGFDTVYASADVGRYTYQLGANVESLFATGVSVFRLWGNELANGLYGNVADNVIAGYTGNDQLDGRAGFDELSGGADNDNYILNDATLINGSYIWDTVIENADEGLDTVIASADVGRYTYQLGANVENLIATGVSVFRLWGNEINNYLEGNTADNVIAGYAGNDLLAGMNGFDQLTGGTGDDTYTLTAYDGQQWDTVIENANEGIDTVYIKSTNSFLLSYTLPDNVENLISDSASLTQLLGSGLNNSLTGDFIVNAIYGYAGNDELNGGNNLDGLYGGLNNDVYILNDATLIHGSYTWDSVIENADEGTDTVYASANVGLYTYELRANVENLVATGNSVFRLWGNILNNRLTGNNAANVIASYAGRDTLVGKGGNDTLTGGADKDILTGGAGGDRFDYKTLTDSLLSRFDVIKDFNATVGNDLFLVTTARSGFSDVGTVATLDRSGIAAKLTTTDFAANGAAQFTFGTRSFVAINNETAGFNTTTDSIIEITGLVGSLSLDNFVIA